MVMRILKINVILLILIAGLSVRASALTITASENIFSRHKISPADTANLNRLLKEAWSQILKSKDVTLLRAYIDTAELICVEKSIEFPSTLHLVRAEYFLRTNDFRSASQEATIAIKLSKSNHEMDVLAKTMSFMGKYSQRSFFYMESISYFENSIEIAEKNKLKNLIPLNYYRLTGVYERLGNLDEVRNSLNKLILAARKEQDTLFLMLGYEGLGKTYLEEGRDYKMADSIVRKCLEIALIKKDTAVASLAHAHLGWNNYLDKKYDAAIKNYNRSLDYSLPAKLISYSANSLGNLGTIYRDLGETEKSIAYYRKSIEQGEKVNDTYNLYWVHADMSEMYLRKRDTSNAYKSYVLYKKYYDQFQKNISSQGLTDAKIRYDVDSHNKEVELLSLRLYNQRLIIYGAAGLLLLSVAVLILLLSRAKINAKRRISEMNRKISEVTQANLRQQMNPHFIFNTLNSIQYYMYQHDKLATNNYLTKFSSLMRKVLENSQHTSVPLSDELDALNLYLELEMIRFKDKFEYKINLDEEIDTLLYKVPTMLIQPYVENSICHGLMPGENKGFLKVDLKLENEYISCTIEDNGIGREAALDRKNKSGNNHNSLGTQIVSSRLDLVNALYGTSLKTIYTDLKNENGEPAGTRVEIQIPILS
ncbi:MAG: histidine kinase [Bacteroidales bacterium]|nr:histidine kinase [Bacteroidales bacterium]